MIDQFLPGGAARGVGPLWATVGHCGPLWATVVALVLDSLLWATIWMTVEKFRRAKDGLQLDDH